MQHKLSRYYLSLLLLFTIVDVNGQIVYENHQSEVYNFLYRMAQKGEIIFQDNIRPLDKNYIAQCLDSLKNKSNELSLVEKKELTFYLQEFNEGSLRSDSITGSKTDFFKKDSYERWRFFTTSAPKFKLHIDPVISGATIQGTGRNVQLASNGISLYGTAGKHWGFYLSYNDVTESGTGVDTLKQNNPETGVSGRIAQNKKSINYTELRGGISYGWKNGSVSFIQDHFLWGYGENGRIVFSDKAPTYPYFRFDYQPLSWLKFNYTHAWLSSGIIDSANAYRTGTTTYGGIRQTFIPKFMASHTLQASLSKGLDLAIGESIIYTDKINVGYLIPILYFKAFDNLVNNNNINAGSNGQMFLQVSSRNQIKKTHLYATVFIDEIRISTIFSKTNSRNQLGFTIGGSVTDCFLPYFTLGAEYTRINPFVYRNLLPAQDFTNNNYLLGDWMGNNADRLILTAKYTPFPRFKCLLRYQLTRKGGAGTLDQQYFQQPQPSFLFDMQNNQKELFVQLSYEWYNRLSISSYFNAQNIHDFSNSSTYQQQFFRIGLNYGL